MPLGRKKIDSAASRLLLQGGQYVVGKGLLPNANLERVKKATGHGPNKNQQHPQFLTRTKMFFFKKRFRLCMTQCMAGEKAAIKGGKGSSLKLRESPNQGPSTFWSRARLYTHVVLGSMRKKRTISIRRRERAACIFGASQWMTKSSVRKDIATTRATCSGWGAILWFFFCEKHVL